MKNLHRTLTVRSARLMMFFLLTIMLFLGTGFWGSTKVEANHPVLVEGNCDSPFPGQDTVPKSPDINGTSGGICGDWDGDGRVGAEEDTDGVDRIFGTITAALGPGTGAAAGTGANQNGTIIIVASGRFAETLYIGETINNNGQGVANPGNVTIEAAPGVAADIDAVLQGDPASGNPTRQGQTGIFIAYQNPNRVVTLRNLNIRNFSTGIATVYNARVIIDRCRVENNIRHNIFIQNNSRVVVKDSQIQGAGFRIGGPTSTPNPGHGILVFHSAHLRVTNSTIAHNAAAGIANGASAAGSVVLYKVATYFNNPDLFGPITISPDPNYSF